MTIRTTIAYTPDWSLFATNNNDIVSPVGTFIFKEYVTTIGCLELEEVSLMEDVSYVYTSGISDLSRFRMKNYHSSQLTYSNHNADFIQLIAEILKDYTNKNSSRKHRLSL